MMVWESKSSLPCDLHLFLILVVPVGPQEKLVIELFIGSHL